MIDKAYLVSGKADTPSTMRTHKSIPTSKLWRQVRDWLLVRYIW